VGTTPQEENVQQLLRHGSKLCRLSQPGEFIMHWKCEVG
jgi:hypothetical protein